MRGSTGGDCAGCGSMQSKIGKRGGSLPAPGLLAATIAWLARKAHHSGRIPGATRARAETGRRAESETRCTLSGHGNVVVLLPGRALVAERALAGLADSTKRRA